MGFSNDGFFRDKKGRLKVRPLDCQILDKKNHLYKGESIDGQTHYGENVLLTYSLLSKQVLLRQTNYTIVQSLQC